MSVPDKDIRAVQVDLDLHAVAFQLLSVGNGQVDPGSQPPQRFDVLFGLPQVGLDDKEGVTSILVDRHEVDKLGMVAQHRGENQSRNLVGHSSVQRVNANFGTNFVHRSGH